MCRNCSCCNTSPCITANFSKMALSFNNTIPNLVNPRNVAECVSRGESKEFDCRNNVCMILPIGNGERLYLCGTNAHNPRDQVVYANLTSLGRHQYVPGIWKGIAKCPFDPEDNSTAVWVESRNLENYLLFIPTPMQSSPWLTR